MEAYRVWVTLNLKGDALKKMEQFNKLTQKTSLMVSKLLKNTNMLSESFSGMRASFSGASTSISRFNANLSSSISKMSMAANKAQGLSAKLNRVGSASGRAAMKGGGGGLGIGTAVAAGYAAKSLAFSAYRTGMTYEKEMGLLTAQNIPGLGGREAESFLNKNKLKGISRVDLLEALVDAGVVTKESESAMAIAPSLAKMKFVGHALGKEGFKMTDRQIQAAIKTSEIVSGKGGSEIINQFLEMMMKTWISTAGRIEPSQYMSIVRSARGYTKGMDPKFFFYAMEPLIQEYGTRVGPMIAQFYQHMAAGRMTTQGAALMSKMGLVDPNKVKHDKTGRIIGVDPGGITGMSEVGSKNIFEWIDKFLIPGLEKAGVKTSSERDAYLGKIYTNSDLALVKTYLQQKDNIMRSAKINEGTMGLDESYLTQQLTRSGKLEQLTNSYKDFALAFDKMTTPTVMKGIDVTVWFMDKFTSLFNVLGDFRGASGAALDIGKGVLWDRIKQGGGSLFDSGSTSSKSNEPINVHTKVVVNGDVLAKAFTRAFPSSFNNLTQYGTSGVNTTQPMSPGLGIGMLGQN